MNRGPDSPADAKQQSPAALFAQPQATPRRRRFSLSRALAVTAVGLFAAAAALGMVKQPDRLELPPSQLVRTALPLQPNQLQVASTDASAPYVSETRIRRGDTLASVLQRLDIDDPDLQHFLTYDAKARSIYKLMPGRAVQAATDASGQLAWLRYIHTPGSEENGQVHTGMLLVQPNGHGGYQAREITENTQTQTRVAVGTITSSLFGATDAAGVPDAITLQMADILGSKIDFLRDLRPGAQFRVVYEVRAHDGRYAGPGRVLALEFINGGKTYNAVWFAPDGKTGAYYDFDGTSLRGTFLRTALKFTRISSTFGMRMHPIHKRWIGHKGVDYAAPTGTPIHATADGVVEFAGWQNGYGNVVILKHGDKYSTLYGHQSKLAPGLKAGDTVTQGQLIGYVGSTGWATGPHLHYEFRVDGTPIDPLSIDLPIARKLDADEVKAFTQATDPYTRQIHLMAELQQKQPDALASADRPQ